MSRIFYLNIFRASVLAFLAGHFVFAEQGQSNTLYNPAGKRDPFKGAASSVSKRSISSIYPTEKYDLEQLSLKAILRIGGKSRALVEAPDKQTFTLVEGDVVGRERATLSRILKSEIIFTQKTSNYLGNTSLIERVISLPEAEAVESNRSNDQNQIKTSDSGRQKTEGAPAVNKSVGTSTSEAVKTITNRAIDLERQIFEVTGQK